MINVSHPQLLTILAEMERSFLRRVSSFASCFTLEAAETICTREQLEENDILQSLTQLVNKSLLAVEEWHHEEQFRLLEIFRQYNHERIQEVEEFAYVRRDLHDTPFRLPKEGGTELRIFTLGSTRIYHEKHALTAKDWKYTRARDLLFYLLCHRFSTKDQIGLALWPDASPSQLRNSFHSTLHHLRKALGRSEWIIFENDLYSFNRTLPYWFDAESFESSLALARKFQLQAPTQAISYLKQAIKLYQGDFLQDSFTTDWYLPERKALQKMYEDALLTLGQLLFADARYEQAATIYRRLIAYDTFIEVAHRELMRCYERQGERSQAMRHYQSLAKSIDDEFGTLPAEETIALFERLRVSDQSSEHLLKTHAEPNRSDKELTWGETK